MSRKNFLWGLLAIISLIIFFSLSNLKHHSFPRINPPSPNLPTSRPSPPSPITIVAVGDIMLGRAVNLKMLSLKDFRYPFLKTAQLTASADLAFGNLESPLVENCPPTNQGMIFCGEPKAVEGLKYAGFDVLSLANNHILNYQEEGKNQTIKTLLENQIQPSTPTQMATVKINQTTFGFLSFDLTQTPTTTSSLIKKTAGERVGQVDVLIVSLHWGVEYAKNPSLWQVELAHQIVDQGASIIVGHHPHVIQPVEKYHQGLIFYSLGNFVFDQPWSEETKKGEIAKITFEGRNIKSYELVPVNIQDLSQPVVPE